MASDEMRLARVDLGEGWIDLGYGEPIIIQDILHNYISPGCLPDNGTLLNSQYQPPKGMKAFIDFLEAKYQAKVVVTNGAKQGIAATMYALKKMGHDSCMMHKPYWTSTPGLITDQGLAVKYLGDPGASSRALFITSPNNPDGKEIPPANMAQVTFDAKAEGIKLIHDAAYYTPIYMQDPCSEKVGDVQIHSFAKMWGLSGLRIGYVVLHDETFLPHVTEFVERACSGVSTASQQVALAVESHFHYNPEASASFYAACRNAIATSRAELMRVSPDVLEVMPCTSNSMFAWCKAGPKLNWQAAKVNMIPGDLFGQPGYVRLNIAVPSDLIKIAVNRLNEAGG